RVLTSALGLLERTDGPIVLEDFPEDAPTQNINAAWSLPFDLPVPPKPKTSVEWAQALSEEMALVRPWWDKARARHGRTAVGVSSQAPEAWPDYASAFLDGKLPAPPAPLTSPAYGLRFLADDLKSFYFEAAQANGTVPSPTQVNPWFFHTTLAGAFLIALREMSLASPDKGLNVAGGRFLVPANWLPQVREA
ncbi:MAG: hypothetical protein O3A88_06170, partial [Proteobacteria bacterium]|nr:hypothetical protein [Pseudomonadota bacterium]